MNLDDQVYNAESGKIQQKSPARKLGVDKIKSDSYTENRKGVAGRRSAPSVYRSNRRAVGAGTVILKNRKGVAGRRLTPCLGYRSNRRAVGAEAVTSFCCCELG